MGKLRILSGQEICAILSNHGFEVVRQHGSHIVMQKKVGKTTITVPVPNHKELAKGTLRAIMNQADITLERLLDLI